MVFSFTPRYTFCYFEESGQWKIWHECNWNITYLVAVHERAFRDGVSNITPGFDSKVISTYYETKNIHCILPKPIKT